MGFQVQSLSFLLCMTGLDPCREVSVLGLEHGSCRSSGEVPGPRVPHRSYTFNSRFTSLCLSSAGIMDLRCHNLATVLFCHDLP